MNQYSVADKATRRPDLLCFVNGIPLAILEFKSAIEEGTTIHDAWRQVCVRYARDIPSLLKYCCVAAICDGANNRLGTVFTSYPYFYAWNKVDDADKVSTELGRSTPSSRAPSRPRGSSRSSATSSSTPTTATRRSSAGTAVLRRDEDARQHLRSPPPRRRRQGRHLLRRHRMRQDLHDALLSRLMMLRRSSVLGTRRSSSSWTGRPGQPDERAIRDGQAVPTRGGRAQHRVSLRAEEHAGGQGVRRGLRHDHPEVQRGHGAALRTGQYRVHLR